MAGESHYNHPQGEESPYFNDFAPSYSTKQDVAKPATDLAFPSVTICAPGLNMEAVKEALFYDFNIWRGDKETSLKSINEFMEEKYAMRVEEGNILDIIRDMNLPSISSQSKNSIAIVDNLVSCEKGKENESMRRKRETLPEGCVLDEGKNYKHPTRGKPDIIFLPWSDDPRQAQNWQECAEFCFQYTEEPCGYWSYATDKTCFLKAPDFYAPRYSHLSRNVKETRAGYVSGNKACGPGESQATRND